MTIRKYLRPVAFMLRPHYWRLIRFFGANTLPTVAGGRALLHLGCGPINAPGYINVDAQPFPHVHHVENVFPLDFLETGAFDLVYASHILEHFPYSELPQILGEWRRVLKIGGVLRLGVPDLEVLFRMYSDTQDVGEVLGPLMGGQTDEHNFHYSVFDERYLTELLREVGFDTIRTWDPDEVDDHSFQDTTSNVWTVFGQCYSISLNLEAIK